MVLGRADSGPRHGLGGRRSLRIGLAGHRDPREGRDRRRLPAMAAGDGGAEVEDGSWHCPSFR